MELHIRDVSKTYSNGAARASRTKARAGPTRVSARRACGVRSLPSAVVPPHCPTARAAGEEACHKHAPATTFGPARRPGVYDEVCGVPVADGAIHASAWKWQFSELRLEGGLFGRSKKFGGMNVSVPTPRLPR
jgi:hypothetical protein